MSPKWANQVSVHAHEHANPMQPTSSYSALQSSPTATASVDGTTSRAMVSAALDASADIG